jgi:hypothetical protein
MAAPAGRPPSAATLARLAAPCCEKCRHLTIGPRRGVGCGKGHTTMALCSDYVDVSRPRAVLIGGISGKARP